MNADLQQILALVIVAAAALGLIASYWRRRKRPGCGGECACPSKNLRRE